MTTKKAPTGIEILFCGVIALFALLGIGATTAYIPTFFAWAVGESLPDRIHCMIRDNSFHTGFLFDPDADDIEDGSYVILSDCYPR